MNHESVSLLYQLRFASIWYFSLSLSLEVSDDTVNKKHPPPLLPSVFWGSFSDFSSFVFSYFIFVSKNTVSSFTVEPPPTKHHKPLCFLRNCGIETRMFWCFVDCGRFWTVFIANLLYLIDMYGLFIFCVCPYFSTCVHYLLTYWLDC